MDISKGGFKFISYNFQEKFMELNKQVEAKIQINEELFILIKVEVRWEENDSYGMQVKGKPEYYFSSNLIKNANFFEELLLEKSDFFSNLTMGQIQILLNYCPDEKFANILEHLPAYVKRNWKKRDFRIEVAMVAVMTNGVHPIFGKVIDISDKGFKFITEKQIELKLIENKIIEMHVELNSKITACIEGRIHWHKKNIYGIKIENPPQEWTQMMSVINKKFLSNTLEIKGNIEEFEYKKAS